MTNKFGKGLSIASLALMGVMASAQEIQVTVDGSPVAFHNGGPRQIDNRVLVPLRGVFEQMGADVRWHPARREVVANRGGSRVVLHIGDRSADVDGKEYTLDVPAMIMNGNTMVPIRFLSESLGAEVHWNSADQMVAITTDAGRAERINQGDDRWQRDHDRDRDLNRGRDRDNTPPADDRPATQILQDNTVIPVTLDDSLSSSESEKGDRFTATVRSNGQDYYSMLPSGTKIEGHVVGAREVHGDDPGMLELSFDRLLMPNGRSYALEGSLVSLEANGITRDANGRIKATGQATKDNRSVYAGYGAGAGLVVGLLTKKPLEGTVIGGILGYLGGQAQHDQNKPHNVTLKPGTTFGVRLNEDISINRRDLRDN